MQYDLVSFQELFTAPWLGIIGSFLTGAAAAYAAFKAVQLAQNEQLRTERLEDRASKGFCLRTIKQIYHVAIHLRLDGERVQERILDGDLSIDPVNDLLQRILDDPIPGLRDGHEALLLLPDPLSGAMISHIAQLDLLRSKVKGLFSGQFFDAPPQSPPTLNEVGLANARNLADRAVSLAESFRSDAFAMQKYVGAKLLPDTDEEVGYAERLRAPFVR